MFSAAEVLALAATQNAWMQDSCQINSYASGVDADGGPTSVYTLYSEIACGVDTGKTEKGYSHDSSGTDYRSDATIRLPLGTSIKFSDHIIVTKRMGVACTQVEYHLTRVPAVGVSCITCSCQKVTT